MTYQPHVEGCPDCEFDRLRKWALEQRIIGKDHGPTNVVSTVIDLVHKMDAKIRQQNEQIRELKSNA